jgi:hypothetical protein
LVTLTQEVFMNIDNISPSILHVTAKQNLHIEDDLNKEATKTIAELLHEEEEKTKEEAESTQEG